MLLGLCKECRTEAVNIFLKEQKKNIPGLTLTFLQPSWERGSSRPLFHEISIASLSFVSSLPPTQTPKNQPQLNHSTTPREQYSGNHTIPYVFFHHKNVAHGSLKWPHRQITTLDYVFLLLDEKVTTCFAYKIQKKPHIS